MNSDQIKQQLTLSSKKVAKEIAKLTLERKKTEEELYAYENSLTKLEAQIEVYRESRDQYHSLLREMKTEKSQLFHIRDELIEKKRSIVKQKYELSGIAHDTLDSKLDNVSNKIGEAIENSKDHSKKMQDIYEKGQEQHELMIRTTNEFRQEKYESQNNILKFKQKISEIDTELNQLRQKMKTIQSKIRKI